MLTIGKSASPASADEAASAMRADHVASQGSDSGKCPLRPVDLDKLTPYRWQVAQYQANRVFIPNATIRIDYCELIGSDPKGSMRSGLMVNIATGANAGTFTKHWRAACADSFMPEPRGKVQPVAGVARGQQCVTANGTSSTSWVESPSRTIQIELLNQDAALATIFPQLLAAAR